MQRITFFNKTLLIIYLLQYITIGINIFEIIRITHFKKRTVYLNICPTLLLHI